MRYEKPILPYECDALAPMISAQTVQYHYGKHTSAYLDNLNKLIVGTPYEQMPLEQIITTASGALFNNAAQAWNHIFYFFSFIPGGSAEPQGELRKAIDRDFGSFEAFKERFVNAGVGLFGSGWVWLSYDRTRKLVISALPNAGNPIRDGLTPLLTFDVWEHAYYLDYQNRRGEALNALWQIVNWDKVAQRFEQLYDSATN